MNLVLIGMPASGKSTTGVLLARSLGMGFVDTDLLIQEKEGRLLQEIIDAEGNPYFKKVEEYVLRTLDADDMVISTGGSAIYYPKAMEHLKEGAVVLYLENSFPVIDKRLQNLSSRGVTLEPGQTLEDLYNSRIPLYEKYADITVNSDNMDIEETVSHIVKMVKEKLQR